MQPPAAPAPPGRPRRNGSLCFSATVGVIGAAWWEVAGQLGGGLDTKYGSTGNHPQQVLLYLSLESFANRGCLFGPIAILHLDMGNLQLPGKPGNLDEK